MGSIELQTQSPPNQEDIKWEKQKSANGKEFETGLEAKTNVDGVAVAKAENRDSHGAPFSLEVGWYVDDQWHTTPDDWAKQTGIQRYIVGHSQHWIYDYYVQIITFQDYDYYFTDATNDRYNLNVWDTAREQFFRYNSDDPTIKRISGS